MNWFLSELECPICNEGTVCLHSNPMSNMECGWCGYYSDNIESKEVPESFAKAEFALAGIRWEEMV